MRTSNLLLLLLLAGCVSSRQGDLPPELTYGMKVPVQERAIVQEAQLERFASEVEVWNSNPVLLNVFVRVNRGAPEDTLGSRRVDVFVRGAFPDACTRLTHLDVSRSLRFLDVTLEQSRPRLAPCPMVNVPFQFTFPLDEALAPGAYVLTLNGQSHPFEVRREYPN